MSITKDVFGYLGGFMLVVTLIPQVYHTYKTKKIRDLSLLFILFQIITCILFLVYGALLVELPLLIANSIVMFQQLLLLYAKMFFKNENTNKIIPNIPDVENRVNEEPPEYTII